MKTEHIKSPLKILFREDDGFNQQLLVEHLPQTNEFLFHFTNDLIRGGISVVFSVDEIKVIKDSIAPFSETRRFKNVNFETLISENETSKFTVATSNRGEPYRDVLEFSIEIGNYEDADHEHASCGLIHSEIQSLTNLLDSIEFNRL